MSSHFSDGQFLLLCFLTSSLAEIFQYLVGPTEEIGYDEQSLFVSPKNILLYQKGIQVCYGLNILCQKPTFMKRKICNGNTLARTGVSNTMILKIIKCILDLLSTHLCAYVLNYLQFGAISKYLCTTDATVYNFTVRAFVWRLQESKTKTSSSVPCSAKFLVDQQDIEH